MEKETKAGMPIYAGLFMVTLSTLMYEILLTRIFSVTMWYHFAFAAISMAMFGMTIGALLVYLLPTVFSESRSRYHLARSALFFSIFTVLSFLVHVVVPISFDVSLKAICSMIVTYTAISIPFIFSGICVCTALTKFPRQVSALYAADLAGAALGCILFKYTLDITDGPTAVIVVAFLASVGSILFASKTELKKLRKVAILCTIALSLFIAINTLSVFEHSPLIRLKWIKGQEEGLLPYEKWNSFSRLTVIGNPDEFTLPFIPGRGFSICDPMLPIQQLQLKIDASASTMLTKFDGDLSDVEFLKCDVINLAHFLRPNANVTVIGVGGGRDILSALAFNQKSVDGIEINDDIVKILNDRFGNFTGHLDRDSRVSFVNDEARSYITRQKNKSDIIQVSFIDTWAATAAGAFVLTENSLYTVEAWKIFLEHLSPNGVLTFSRWLIMRNPAEIFRLISLAAASLKAVGVENPRNHIILIGALNYGKVGVGTILLSREPFSLKDIEIVGEVVKEKGFKTLLTPQYSENMIFGMLASGVEQEGFTNEYPLNISPPTDDKPFFFQMLKLKSIFKKDLLSELDDPNIKAVFILGILLIIVIVLTLIFIILPLAITANKVSLGDSFPLFIYFAAIGFGFIFIEISQMQRLIIFLGHPTYSLSVVLFALLLSSGLGSYETRRLREERFYSSALIRLVLLIILICVFGLLTQLVINILREAITPIRILAAIAILFPLGFFMGMAFPIGMKLASLRTSSLTPWLWGINGATSVCGSVLSVTIALTAGISASFWTGFTCYIISFVAFYQSAKRKEGVYLIKKVIEYRNL